MKKVPEQTPPAATKSRNGLRLVSPVPEVEQEPLPKPAKPKSALVSFFNAYADAIDRDVKLLLEI